MVLAMVLTVYALTKLNILVARSAPIMASYIDRNAVPADEKLNFARDQLTFAFGIEGFLDGEFKDDPRYVKTFARLYGFDENGETYEKFLPHHVCTKEDYDQFAPPSSDAEFKFNQYYSGEKKLYCLDWDGPLSDQMSVWSQEKQGMNYQRLEFTLVPCNYLHIGIDDSDSDEEVSD